MREPGVLVINRTSPSFGVRFHFSLIQPQPLSPARERFFSASTVLFPFPQCRMRFLLKFQAYFDALDVSFPQFLPNSSLPLRY